MAPTRIYVKPLLALMRDLQVKGMAHITGGGLVENIPRILPDGVQARIDAIALAAPADLRLAAAAGQRRRRGDASRLQLRHRHGGDRRAARCGARASRFLDRCRRERRRIGETRAADRRLRRRDCSTAGEPASAARPTMRSASIPTPDARSQVGYGVDADHSADLRPRQQSRSADRRFAGEPTFEGAVTHVVSNNAAMPAVSRRAHARDRDLGRRSPRVREPRGVRCVARPPRSTPPSPISSCSRASCACCADALVRRHAGRMLNIHPSLLPAYPGLHTHRRALADGVRIHGCTVHFVTPAVDAGPIVAQAAVPVRADDDEATLAARVLAAGASAAAGGRPLVLRRAARRCDAGRVRLERAAETDGALLAPASGRNMTADGRPFADASSPRLRLGRPWWRPRRALVVALALSLGLHLALSLVPDEPPDDARRDSADGDDPRAAAAARGLGPARSEAQAAPQARASARHRRPSRAAAPEPRRTTRRRRAPEQAARSRAACRSPRRRAAAPAGARGRRRSAARRRPSSARRCRRASTSPTRCSTARKAS